MKNEYVGIYDHKESDTFRPTLKSRIHQNSPVSKTLTCREDSCCVIERERERERIFAFVNSRHWSVCSLWDLRNKTMTHCGKSVKVIHKFITKLVIQLSPRLSLTSCHLCLTPMAS